MEKINEEYSHGIPSNGRLIRKTIGFLNSKGGEFIIGIDDNTKKPTKMKFTQQDEERVLSILLDNIKPIPRVIQTTLTKHFSGDKIVIEISEGHNTPYYEKNKGIPKGVYIRIGSVTRNATNEDITRLFRKSKNISYDEEIITHYLDLSESSIKIFNKVKIEEYIKNVYSNRGIKLTEITDEHIININSAIKINGKLYPTIGGILMFCEAPDKYFRDLDYCYIIGARFKGDNSSSDIIDQKDFKGTLDSQVLVTYNFIKSHLNLGGAIRGIKREDILEIPEFVIRELLVNAVVHRDYSMSGSTIKIAIFDDRIEVFSPGGFPAGVTAKNIKNMSVIRNKVIAEYFFNKKFIERFGIGWDNILSNLKEAGLSKPEIIDDESYVKVIIKRRNIKPLPRKGIIKDVLSNREINILSNLEHKKEYNIEEIMEILNEPNELGLKQVLGQLKRKKYIDSNKGKYRKIKGI